MTARQLSSRVLIAAFAVVASVTPARAQEAALAAPAAAPAAATPAPRTDSAAATAAGPTREAAALAVHTNLEAARTLPAPAARRSGFSQGETLMIVGGAAILTGIVVGGGAGHAISVGGAVVGLIGLYQYLQ